MDFAERLIKLRKKRGLTQEELADKLGVSGQAVSKWETGNSMPDVALLGQLAHVLGVTVDDLLGIEPEKKVELEEKTDVSSRVIHVAVESAEGDQIKLNLPFALVKAFVKKDGSIPMMVQNDGLKDIDFAQIIECVSQGLIGELVSVDSADGDRIRIYVD